ncbi:hypothetical protein CCAX7_15080 [Capsulimonas corticalis]|uniref:Uncharacterized protein n=1 Tax=Capsulimonas corticalis TaxID=2219043 RepID=A0A402CZB1_9BACT|nr:hypothetical protein [Capsulimonas corticalis]BDI29457.1 hypothetical protein CCAX7_15080 [Capsulimonas corticalis]
MEMSNSGTVTVQIDCEVCGGVGGRTLHTTGDFIPCGACRGTKFRPEEINLGNYLADMSAKISILTARVISLETDLASTRQELAGLDATLVRSWREVDHLEDEMSTT